MLYLLVDIIIFAAIAFYIFFKLNKQLGKIDEEERDRVIKNAEKNKIRNLIQNSSESSIEDINSKEFEANKKIIGFKSTKDALQDIENDPQLSNLQDADKKSLAKILEKSNMTSQFFINGAKIAFESILKAFASDKLEDVQTLLSQKIYEGFKSVNNKRKVQGKILVTNIIAFDESSIIKAKNLSNTASITVRFVSQQINYICDKDGNLIAGSKDEINKIEDIWTFKKDLKSSNPNWIVSATSHV